MTEGLADDLATFLADKVVTLEVFASHVGAARNATSEELSAIARRTRAKEVAIDRLIVTDAQLRSIAADPPTGADGGSSLGIDYSDRGYIRDALQNKRTVVEKNVVIGRAARRPLISVVAPIVDGSGQAIGVAASGIDISRIAQLTARVKFGKSGRAIVTSATGTVIAHPDPTFAAEQRDLSKSTIWKDLSAADRGIIPSFIDSDGDERFASFATVPGVGWKVWISQSKAELSEDLFATYRGVAAWLVGAVLGALILVVAFSRMLARPIVRLHETALAIAAGDLAKSAPETGPRELRDLARAMNRMAEALRGLIEGERAAKERLARAVGVYGALAARVAGGDLAARAAASEEPELGQLGESLNRMIEALARMVGEIREAAANLVSASSEILAASSQQVSATAEEAAAVKQTASTIGEVRQTSDLAAKKAKEVAEAATRSMEVALEGNRSVEESIRGIEDAKQRMEALATRILGFSEQVQAIGEINATVNDIAEQSNLLAVNAAIEAAKAGEAGRGFAVVAAEVKALADQCRQATAQVRGILNEVQRATQGAVMAAEQGVKAAEGGVGTALRSGEAIRLLSESVSDAAQAAQQILASAQQQAVGTDQIALAMRNIEQSSSQTVSATAQVQRSARDLNDLARSLEKSAGSMRVATGG